jgi:hypothetical protein
MTMEQTMIKSHSLLSCPSTPEMQTNSAELPTYTFVLFVQLPEDTVQVHEEDEIPRPNTPEMV